MSVQGVAPPPGKFSGYTHVCTLLHVLLDDPYIKFICTIYYIEGLFRMISKHSTV